MTYKIAGMDSLTLGLASGVGRSILGITEDQRSLVEALTATGALGEAYRNAVLGSTIGALGIDSAMSDFLRPYKRLADVMHRIPSMDLATKSVLSLTSSIPTGFNFGLDVATLTGVPNMALDPAMGLGSALQTAIGNLTAFSTPDIAQLIALPFQDVHRTFIGDTVLESAKALSSIILASSLHDAQSNAELFDSEVSSLASSVFEIADELDELTELEADPESKINQYVERLALKITQELSTNPSFGKSRAIQVQIGILIGMLTLIFTVYMAWQEHQSSQDAKHIIEAIEAQTEATHQYSESIEGLFLQMQSQAEQAVHDSQANGTHYILNRSLWIHAKPNMRSDKVTWIFKGELVTLVYRSRKWVEIEYYNPITGTTYTGWARKKYFSNFK